ncbi:ATP-binding cassette domain-containing protein [Myxococcota bacterium]|nr:ATP-binding cassette domain-containing protein [Myxococcota bacterium]
MVELRNITLQHGHQVVFLGASMKLNPGEKVGLVGPNGAGKTTLFRLILGEQSPDEGTVERPRRLTTGWFRQDFADLAARSVLEETLAGAGPLAALGEELVRLEERLGDHEAPDHDEVIERYGEVQSQFAAGGGYDLEARAATILAGLGFRQDELAGPVSALSGGWRMRVQLARLLLARPELLLLDEPTNYLDIESIIWLEGWLRDYPGTVLLTCHDRDVMNRVVRRVIEIDGGQMRSYTGDYDAYERARALDAAQREAEYQKQQAALAKDLRFIERFKAQPAKASQVQSRAKKVDKIERVEPPRRFVERRFHFRRVERSGDEVLKVQGVSKAYAGRSIHRDLRLLVRRGERWAIMGENGAGKTTLLKMMAGALPPDQGRVELGAAVQMGWFAQHQAEQLDGRGTVLEELEAHAPTEGRGVLKALAAAFGFSQDDADKPVSVLSGGERSRLVLAKLLYKAPNLLILDEPTNHLDLSTKRALIQALQQYEGTVVFVSHDRTFLRALATRVVELGGAQPRVYEGSYDEYVQATGREAPGLRQAP